MPRRTPFRAKCDLREAVKAANLSVLNASIEQYSDEGRAVSVMHDHHFSVRCTLSLLLLLDTPPLCNVQKELKEAKVKRSELMSKVGHCAEAHNVI
jgi:hypothetical protein